MRGRNAMRVVAALLVAMAWLSRAGAQGVGASSPLDERAPADTRSGHAWIAERGGAANTVILQHIPPRDTRVFAITSRAVRELDITPETMVVMPGGKVYLIATPSRRAEGDYTRRVSSVEPRRAGPGGWSYWPEARIETEPMLRARGAVRGATGSAIGPVVLTDAAPDAAPSAWAIHVLWDSKWSVLEPPASMAGRALPLRVSLATGAGAVVLVEGGGVDDADKVRVYLGTLSAKRGEAPRVEWSGPRVISLRSTRGEPMAPPAEDLQFASVDGSLIAWTLVRGRLSVLRDEGGVLRPLGSLDAVPQSAIVLPLHGLSRLAAVWRGEALAGATDRPLMAAQISTLDGRVLPSTPVSTAGLLTTREIGLLALLFLSVLAVVLLFVLRRDDVPQLAIPKGTALARPVKRAAAACVDLLGGSLLATVITGRSLGSLWGLDAELDPQGFLEGGLIVTVCVVGMSTLGEWLFARTPGKLLLGIAVVGLTRAAEGQKSDAHGEVVGSVRISNPTFVRALVRNLVKWVLTPLTLMILFEPNLRHPGDIASRTLVIEPAEESGPERGPGEGG
jgi:uncharacterized RDD family membrane protein YckC